MSAYVEILAENCAVGIEALGVLLISGVTLYCVLLALVGVVRRQEGEPVYQRIRVRLGRGILLGLELLVAADIIHTVAVELTFETVGVLAIVVVIRTFLSFTLELELTGRWPWQEPREAHTSHDDRA